MGRKVLGTAVVLLFLGIIVVIARHNHSLEDWKTSESPGQDPAGGSESESPED